MTLPRWNDPSVKAGTMVRSALWLISEVGLGNSFTKEQHRLAFSGVTQADRRLRDLRDYGWVINTSAEDLTLNPDEQRFVSLGLPVWQRGIRRTSSQGAVTAKIRRGALAASGYQCVICGVAGGERYPDGGQATAVLAICRREVTGSDGVLRLMLVTECKRCRSGTTNPSIDVPLLLAQVDRLEAPDRVIFLSWIGRGRQSVLDRLWSQFLQLPAGAQDDVRRQLGAG